MLLTIQIANSRLANHYMDETATYVSDFNIKSVKTRKGLASDSISFTLHKDIFDAMDEPFIYSCHNTSCSVRVDDTLIFDGFVNKLSTEKNNNIKFELQSLSKWFLSSDATPKVSVNCQNQLGSTNCGVVLSNYNITFSDVEVDGFTGYVPLNIDKANESITLGGDFLHIEPIVDGNLSLYDGNLVLKDPSASPDSAGFFELENWIDAYVVINGLYKTNIVNVTRDAIYLALNFTNTKLVAETLDIYMKCDKTYGQCYKRFNNVSNFYGFPNNRDDISLVDIFSATNLSYCGQEEQEFLECPTDNNLYGVEV